MTRLLIQEVNNPTRNGEKCRFARIKVNRQLSTDEFLARTLHSGCNISRGTVMAVLDFLSEALARTATMGYSVKLDGLGTFRMRAGIKKGKQVNITAADVEIKGMTFTIEKRLKEKLEKESMLENGGKILLHTPDETQEQRLGKAQKFLNKHKTMTVSEYMHLTGLSKTSALRELHEWAQQSQFTGITTAGRRSRTLFVSATISHIIRNDSTAESSLLKEESI